MKTRSQTRKEVNIVSISNPMKGFYMKSILTLMKRAEHGDQIKNQWEMDNINMYAYLKRMVSNVVRSVIKNCCIVGLIETIRRSNIY